MSETTIKEQAAKLLTHVAGYVAHRTVDLGLRHGLFEELAEHPDGVTTDELAEQRGLDPFYTEVWTRSALAAGVVERAGDGFALTPHADTLLLDTESPAYIGGVFTVLEKPEVFDTFDERFASGQRTWWDETSPEWIQGVSSTGRPFYIRLIPDGLAQVPGLADRLESGGRILETACGAGVGLVRLATTYPQATVVGVDGDAYSLELAAKRLSDAGVSDQVQLVESPLEEFEVAGGFDVAINNISMHECRDIDGVTERTREALAPGGWFVISDFPFPDDDEGLQTVPGRIMSGIQFFEAQIDDQLVPVSFYLDLLARHGFDEVDEVTLTPVHALTFGRVSEDDG